MSQKRNGLLAGALPPSARAPVQPLLPLFIMSSHPVFAPAPGYEQEEGIPAFQE
jgi:hypothetical protein